MARKLGIRLVGGRSREGAWIEIEAVLFYIQQKHVAPARERGLKFEDTIKPDLQVNVAPARERGLK